MARSERKERFISGKGKFRDPFYHFSLSRSLALCSLPLVFLSRGSLPYYHRPRTTCIINGRLRAQWDEKQPWVISPRKILLAVTCTGKHTGCSRRFLRVFSYLAASPAVHRRTNFPRPFKPRSATSRRTPGSLSLSKDADTVNQNRCTPSLSLSSERPITRYFPGEVSLRRRGTIIPGIRGTVTRPAEKGIDAIVSR